MRGSAFSEQRLRSMITPSPTQANVSETVRESGCATAALLSIRKVAKHFGKNAVLRDISLEVAEGEFLTILGESGSGKTTLLRIIAGFETASAGEIGWARSDWIACRLTGAA